MYWANKNNDRSTANATLTGGSTYVLTFTHAAVAFSANDPIFYSNGVNKASTQGAGTGTPDILEGITSVGAGLAGGSAFGSNIYEEIVFNIVLTTAQRTALEATVNQYYRIY